jgi:hypothetical protein
VKIIVIEISLLQAEEGHTPLGSPQGSKFLLKIIKMAKRKCHITLLNTPEKI